MASCAVEVATLSCQLSEWKDADCLDTLAAACAETGDFPAAIKSVTKAIELITYDLSPANHVKEFKMRDRLKALPEAATVSRIGLCSTPTAAEIKTADQHVPPIAAYPSEQRNCAEQLPRRSQERSQRRSPTDSNLLIAENKRP